MCPNPEACFYPPYITCTCSIEGFDNAWHCEDLSAPLIVDGTHPASIDEMKRVRDLTDAERQTWCEWYAVLNSVYRPPLPLPPETPLTPHGYTTNQPCTVSAAGFQCRGAVPTSLPISYCKGNLALSECEAPLSELNDCVLTMQRECRPSPFGCAPYLGAPGCSGTIVTALGPNGIGGNSSTGGSTGTAGPDGSDSTDPGSACSVRVQ